MRIFILTLLPCLMATPLAASAAEMVNDLTAAPSIDSEALSAVAQPTPEPTTTAPVVARDILAVENNNPSSSLEIVTITSGDPVTVTAPLETSFVTQAQPKTINVMPNGRPVKQKPELNYCHVHVHPLYIMYRISGQMWGGKNITAEQMWTAMADCGYMNERRHWRNADPENWRFMTRFSMGIIGTKGCITNRLLDLGAPKKMCHCTSHYDHKKWDHDIDNEIASKGSSPGTNGFWHTEQLDGAPGNDGFPHDWTKDGGKKKEGKEVKGKEKRSWWGW